MGRGKAFRLLAAHLVAFLAATLSFASAPCAADTLFVCNSGNNSLWQFSMAGAGSPFATTGLGGPRGLALDSLGNIYVSNQDDDSLTRFIPGSPGAFFAYTLPGAYGVACDAAGNIYVANFLNNSIQKFTPGGTASVFASTGLNNPTGLAFDRAGNLYAANFATDGAGYIEKFTPGGVGSVFSKIALAHPVGLTFDGTGNLYAADYGNDTIEKFAPTGSGSVFANDPRLDGLLDVACDSAGNVYASSFFNNTIFRFNTAGAGSVFATTGVNGPTAIEFVPEPGRALFIIPALLCFYRLRLARARAGDTNQDKQ